MLPAETFKSEPQNSAAGGPALSVIVPVYNAGNDLRECLTALSKSRCDDYEVLVVDDGSDIPVEPLVRSFGFQYLRLNGPFGPAQARNRGVAAVSGEHVVFIDADVCVHDDTLARFQQAFAADPTITGVIGSYDNAPAHPSFLSQYKNLFHHYVHQQSSGTITTFWTGCGAMKREVFMAFGGFDEKRYRRPAIEDIELGTWMTASGHRIVLDSRIEAKHLKRWTFWNLLKTDIFDRGIPWTQLMLRAGEISNTLNVKPTQKISVVLTYLAILATLGSLLWPPLLLLVATLVVIVTILNLDFYRFFAKRGGIWFTVRVVPLHWLYFTYCGFSFVAGTVLHYLHRKEEAPANPLGDRAILGD